MTTNSDKKTFTVEEIIHRDDGYVDILAKDELGRPVYFEKAVATAMRMDFDDTQGSVRAENVSFRAIRITDENKEA